MTFLGRESVDGNQPLLRNGPRKHFGEIMQNKAITPFKVIQGHDFGTNRKLNMRLLISD